MILVDLYLPDDMPPAADAELGQELARIIDAYAADVSGGSVVYVHRLPVFGVVSAGTEGVRMVRVQISSAMHLPAALDRAIEGAVLGYLDDASPGQCTRVTVAVLLLMSALSGRPVVTI